MSSLFVSHIFDKELSNLLCICVTTWVFVDRMFVKHAVLEENIFELQNKNAKLREEIILLNLKIKHQEIKYWKHLSLKNSSCHF
jgi:hypothetical protein